MPFILLIIAVVVIGGPLLLIWAVNTLFATGIGYNLATWFAALILGGVVSSNAKK